MMMLVFGIVLHLLGVCAQPFPGPPMTIDRKEMGNYTYSHLHSRDASGTSTSNSPAPATTDHLLQNCEWFPLPMKPGVVPILPDMYEKWDPQHKDEDNNHEKRDNSIVGRLCLPEDYTAEEISFGLISVDSMRNKKTISDIGSLSLPSPASTGIVRCNAFPLPPRTGFAPVMPEGYENWEMAQGEKLGMICLPEGYRAQDIEILVHPSVALDKTQALDDLEERGGNPKGTGTTVTLGPPFTYGKLARGGDYTTGGDSHSSEVTGIAAPSDIFIDIQEDQLFQPRWIRRASNPATNARQDPGVRPGINPIHPHRRNLNSPPEMNSVASTPTYEYDPDEVFPSQRGGRSRNPAEYHEIDKREVHTDPNEKGVYTSNGLKWGTDDIRLPGDIHDRGEIYDGHTASAKDIKPRVITEPNFWLPGEPFDSTTSHTGSTSTGPELVSRATEHCSLSKREVHTDPNEPGVYTSNGLKWGADDIRLPGDIHDRLLAKKEYHTDPNEPGVYTSNGLKWGADDIRLPGDIHDRSWAQARKTQQARAAEVPSSDGTSVEESSALPIPPEWTGGPYMLSRDTTDETFGLDLDARSQKCRCSLKQLDLLSDIDDDISFGITNVNVTTEQDGRRIFSLSFEGADLWDAYVKRVKRGDMLSRQHNHEHDNVAMKERRCVTQSAKAIKERIHDLEHCPDPSHHEEHLIECAESGKCDRSLNGKKKRIHDLEHCPDPAHHQDHLLECAQGGNCERSSHGKRSSTYTCDKQCLVNWDICEKDRRWCCKLADFKEMDYHDRATWTNGEGWERMLSVLAKMPGKCRPKPSGPEECGEDEAIACYWKDDDGPTTACLTWHPTGGETTNFFAGLAPNSDESSKKWVDRWFVELYKQWEKEDHYNELRGTD